MLRSSMLALAAIVCFAGFSEASILGRNLTFDGVVDELLDESRTNHYDAGGDGFGVGDVLYGFASISDQQPDFGSITDEIAIVYSFEVTGFNAGTGVFSLGSSTVAGMTLDDLLADFSPVTNGLGTAAYVVLANDGSTDPLNPAIGPAGLSAGFNSTDWTYQMTAGYATGGNDYTDVVDLGGVANLQFAIAGGFSVLDDTFGGGTVYNPVASTHLDTTTVTGHDMTLFDGTIFTRGQDGWDHTDKATFALNTVPEPASILTWGGLLGAGLFVAARRRRNKKNA